MRGICVVLCLVFSISVQAFENADVYEGAAHWPQFKDYVLERQRKDELSGQAYMISGALAAVGGSIGYQQSEEIFSRTIFAITSNVGLAAIGWGATYYWTGNEFDSFYHAVEGSSLSLKQKNELLWRYLEKERQEKKRRKWIRAVTHSLIAVANIYSASQESNSDIRSVFYFLGGANLVFAVSYSF